jgi:hypothetical protein
VASKAYQAEINWMACALIKARDSAAIYAALVELVIRWPERKLCALAAKLAPTPGLARDRLTALMAIQAFSEGIPREIAARMRVAVEEIAQISDVFRAQ